MYTYSSMSTGEKGLVSIPALHIVQQDIHFASDSNSECAERWRIHNGIKSLIRASQGALFSMWLLLHSEEFYQVP